MSVFETLLEVKKILDEGQAQAEYLVGSPLADEGYGETKETENTTVGRLQILADSLRYKANVLTKQIARISPALEGDRDQPSNAIDCPVTVHRR